MPAASRLAFSPCRFGDAVVLQRLGPIRFGVLPVLSGQPPMLIDIAHAEIGGSVVHPGGRIVRFSAGPHCGRGLLGGVVSAAQRLQRSRLSLHSAIGRGAHRLGIRAAAKFGEAVACLVRSPAGPVRPVPSVPRTAGVFLAALLRVGLCHNHRIPGLPPAFSLFRQESKDGQVRRASVGERRAARAAG
jgi:hypothetical protein